MIEEQEQRRHRIVEGSAVVRGIEGLPAFSSQLILPTDICPADRFVDIQGTRFEDEGISSSHKTTF